MKKQKLLPLACLAAIILLLALALLLLGGRDEAQEETGVPLCPFSAEEITGVSYAGNNLEFTLVKGREGNWMLEADPTLPLDASAVEELVEGFASLTAQRVLQDGEQAELPERRSAPLIELTVTAGEQTMTLQADSLNEVADVYYVYDEDGGVCTVAADDLDALAKTPRQLYAAQTLTEESADDVTSMTVNGETFLCTDGVWSLQSEPDFALDQNVVKRMANTVCQLTTVWSITAPDGGYGLEQPDVTAVLTFADGSTLTVQFGSLTADDETLCYCSADSAPGVVYEVSAAHKSYFSLSKSALAAASTAETAASDAASRADIIAEAPVGGIDDYAD